MVSILLSQTVYSSCIMAVCLQTCLCSVVYVCVFSGVCVCVCSVTSLKKILLCLKFGDLILLIIIVIIH